MIYVIATIEVKPGKRDAFLAVGPSVGGEHRR